jgi:hypothetical protein
LLVVRRRRVDPEEPAWQAQLAALASDFRRWTGTDLRFWLMDSREVRDRQARSDEVLSAMQRRATPLIGGSAAKRGRAKH